MLILFDIDGTLLLSGGAGLQAMGVAGRRLYGDHFSFDGIEFAGRLDPLIWTDAVAAHGIDPTPEGHDEFRATYAGCLAERFSADPSARALPGVHDLVASLGEMDGLTLGLLTGNYPETARLKLETAGIDRGRFAVGAWGCDGATRRELPPVAIERFASVTGRTIGPGRVVVIGDTPHDVDCALANGCLAVGVATGPSYDRASLETAGADLVLDDLADVEAIRQWLLERAAAPVG